MTAAVVDGFRRHVPPQSRLLVLAALPLLVALAGFLYVVKPALAESRELRREVSEGGALPDVVPLEREVAARRERVETLRRSVYGPSANVPREEVEAMVVDTLGRASAHHAVDLRGVRPDAPRRVEDLSELPFEVEAAGDYRALHAWLVAVEEELRPMVLSGFQMRPDTEGGVLLTVQVVAYRAAEGEAR